MFDIRSTLVSFIVVLFSSGITLAGAVVSGPQVGDKVPGPFKPLNLTGPEAGQTACQYCKNGTHPVVVVFAQTITPELAQLLKKIDSVTANQRERGLGSYVVVCSDAPGLDRQLVRLSQQLKIQNTILTLYKAGGPPKYRLSAEADITVLLYSHFTVKSNHAFNKGELTEAAQDAILADLCKMLSEN